MKTEDVKLPEVAQEFGLVGLQEPKRDEEIMVGDTTIEDLDKEQLIEVIKELYVQLEEKPKSNTYVVEPIMFGDEEMIVLSETDEFIEGVKIASRLIGITTTLISSGWSKEESMEVAKNEHMYNLSGSIVKEQTKIARGSIL